MIGGGNYGPVDLSKYLINFDSSAWANQANKYLQSSLDQGLKYSTDYSKKAINAVQDYNQQAQNQLNQGYQQAQALNAPQHLATYNALDAYQQSLGLPTPQGGSFQLAQSLDNQATGQNNTAQQNRQANGFDQGVLSNLPTGRLPAQTAPTGQMQPGTGPVTKTPPNYTQLATGALGLGRNY